MKIHCQRVCLLISCAGFCLKKNHPQLESGEARKEALGILIWDEGLQGPKQNFDLEKQTQVKVFVGVFSCHIQNLHLSDCIMATILDRLCPCNPPFFLINISKRKGPCYEFPSRFVGGGQRWGLLISSLCFPVWRAVVARCLLLLEEIICLARLLYYLLGGLEQFLTSRKIRVSFCYPGLDMHLDLFCFSAYNISVTCCLFKKTHRACVCIYF